MQGIPAWVEPGGALKDFVGYSTPVSPLSPRRWRGRIFERREAPEQCSSSSSSSLSSSWCAEDIPTEDLGKILNILRFFVIFCHHHHHVGDGVS